MQRITIVKIRRAGKNNINEELQWVGNSLGLFNLRDRDSSCFRVFITLVRNRQPISSDEVAHRLNLTRGTAVHHLHHLIDAGIVTKEKEGYILREGSLENLIGEIQRDAETIFGELRKIAKDIDENIG